MRKQAMMWRDSLKWDGCERNMKGVTQGDITIWKARDKKHADTYK